MACYNPLEGYRLESGAVKIAYEPEGSTEKLMIPCGRCIGCRLEYAKSWSIRCRHEASLWDQNQFVTLTYDDDHLPHGESLVPEHLTLFMKRLRKSYSGYEKAPDGRFPIRFFAAGEYGERTKRPHFHLLLFNTFLHRGEQVTSETWTSPELDELWPYGTHAVGAVTPASASYVAQYALKKVRGRVAARKWYQAIDPNTGEVFDRVPEFVRMSRRPGLGQWWFDRYARDLHRGYVVIDGEKHRLPRYYQQRLEADPELAYTLEIQREEYRQGMDPGEISPERLEAREAVVKSRRSLLSRERSF